MINNQKQIVVGTTYKAVQKAKVTGQICLQDLDLFDIIAGLVNYCQIDLNFETQQLLEQKARYILAKNKDICKYREKNLNDIKFIK